MTLKSLSFCGGRYTMITKRLLGLVLIQDRRGLWHCIGIHRPETTMFHAVSESLTRPFRFLENIESGDLAVTNMWAPFAVWQNQQHSLLYYCHSSDGMNVDKFSLRMLLADAPGLENQAGGRSTLFSWAKHEPRRKG